MNLPNQARATLATGQPVNFNLGGSPDDFDIQWMPPGPQSPCCFVAGEAKTLTFTVKPQHAAAFNAMLQQMRTKAAAGTGDEPFIDFNHEDGRASGRPTEIYWAGSDPAKGGIRLKGKWTPSGKVAVQGKEYARFSPEWFFDDKQEPSAIGANLGGLVNKAAFTHIQPVKARAAQSTPQMSMVNKRVPFCLISTPQFLERQIAWERSASWNSAQFLGRLGLSKRLPVDLSVEDLMAVGSSILPEVESKTLRVLAAYARQSARYLAAIDSVADRARYVASCDGRQTVTTEDVRTAMREGVIPSDSALVRTLEQGKKIKGNGNIQPAPALEPEPEQPPVAAPARAIRPVAEIGTTMRHVGDVAELV